jgi:vancomycin resistance protein YoaR
MSSISYPVSRPRFSLEQALISIFIGLLIFAGGTAAFIAGSRIVYAGRIFPGVQIAGVDVGGLRPQEAAARLTTSVTYPVQGKILLRDGDRIWPVTPGQLGLILDPQTSASLAYEVGRNGWLVSQLQEQFYSWYSGHNILPSFVFDERTAYTHLSGLAKEIDIPIVEASIALNGTEVTVLPGQVGRTLDIPRSLVLVSVQLQSLRDGVIDLIVQENSPVIMDAGKQAELARTILSQPLTISLPKEETDAGPWSIEPGTLASMLAFERVKNETGEQFDVRLNPDAMRLYLANIAPSLSRYPQNARFIFNDDTRLLEPIAPAVVGRELDVDKSIQAVQEAMVSGSHSATLVMNYTNPPALDTTPGEELGIRELVSAQTSYFYGSSAARVQNIQTAASKFHGLLVAPGETFSMASALGDITLDNGYAEALIIIGGQTIKGVGGGVCQVSTTLFRAAFFGGFPIVERHAHAYRVYYYEKAAGNRIDPNLVGLDATVFVPIVDFKFRNDTPHWLLMETYVQPGSSSITWKFYSTSEGRRVEVSNTGATNVVPAPDPVYRENSDLSSGTIKQVDWAAEGADVTVSRTVYRGDAIYFQDQIYTHYQPWADVYEYGPGTELPDKEPKPEG